MFLFGHNYEVNYFTQLARHLLIIDWRRGLQAIGTYYKGSFNDLDNLLSSAKATVTRYDTRRSSKASGNAVSGDKENISTDQVEVINIDTSSCNFITCSKTYPA